MAKLGNCKDDMFQEDSCCVNDEVCLTVELGDLVEDEPFVFWTNTSNLAINGTVVVNNIELGDDEGTTVELIVNGAADLDNPAFIIEPGDTKSFTIQNLQSLALEAESVSGDGENTAKVSFSLNYKF